MARRFYYVERKDNAVDKSRAEQLHNITKAYQYGHGLASEFEALYELLSKKPRKEREEKRSVDGSAERRGERGGRSGASDQAESEAVRND